MNEIIKSLEKLNDQIQEAKKNISQFEGQEIQLLKQLKELGYKSVAEAEKALTVMGKEIAVKQDEIEKGFNQLQEEYEW